MCLQFFDLECFLSCLFVFSALGNKSLEVMSLRRFVLSDFVGCFSVVNPDQTYEIRIDKTIANKGSLLEDFRHWFFACCFHLIIVLLLCRFYIYVQCIRIGFNCVCTHTITSNPNVCVCVHTHTHLLNRNRCMFTFWVWELLFGLGGKWGLHSHRMLVRVSPIFGQGIH